ncbi:MAG: hypothetical protein KDK30_10115 [Leptospiraceae bacterium]|nr:hypothetical protein [Leptospiraceae bacterium]MCB1315589.1 hypothetical protein [Leptospiraceae bacterium]MCB1318753.1 hypothetical protein [Leptospiraceae bacterium]
MLLTGPLVAQDVDGLADQFSYDGDVRARGIFLWRDLPLPSAPVSEDDPRTEQGYDEYFFCKDYPTYCNSDGRKDSPRHEQQDFYGMRFRLNLAFRPTSYADILYGVEVGELIFGRESQKYGPGSGGRGAGRTNLETRQLIFRLHNEADTVSGSVGVFSLSTPNGIVLATSGAGVRGVYEEPSIDSSFEGIYVRSVDNSRIDGDSNGFSDDNFVDIELGVARWKWAGVSWLRSELYGVYRVDDDPSASDDTDSDQETSRMYWGGLHLNFNFGTWGFLLHGVGNWGRFHRPLSDDPFKDRYEFTEPFQSYLTEALKPPLREQYRVNAGAGEARIWYYVTDWIEVSLIAAGGSGRAPGDVEPDGTSIDYRPDQFRTAGSGYQFSEIALDGSGGYSIFSAGRLTGVIAQGASVDFQVLETLSLFIAYFHIEALRTPTIDYNQNYTARFNQRKPTNYLGKEWNAALTWKYSTDLDVVFKLATFDAGSGYKALQDVEYGDDLFESQFYITQKF